MLLFRHLRRDAFPRMCALFGFRRSAPTLDVRIGWWQDPFAVHASADVDTNTVHVRCGLLVNRTAREYTILHELTHLRLNVGGHGKRFRRTLASVVHAWFECRLPENILHLVPAHAEDVYAFDRAAVAHLERLRG